MTLEPIAWRGTHVEIPQTRELVLVYGPELVGVDNKHVTAAWFDRDAGAWKNVYGGEVPAVTHWAELPTGAGA